MTEKGLISKIYKQLIQLNYKKQATQLKKKKIGRRPKETFLQRRHTSSQKTFEKKWSNSIIIREMQVKIINEVPLHTGRDRHHQKVYK